MMDYHDRNTKWRELEVASTQHACTAKLTANKLYRQQQCRDRFSFCNWPSTPHPAMSSSQQFSADQCQLPADIQQSLQLRDTQLCCYPSKRCQNLRVMKRTGELHRLCEYHRMKANVNQRRLEQRRRMRTNGTAAATRLNQVEEFASHRLSLPDLNAADTSDLELDVLDEFLAQADIELSPVSATSHSYVHDFIDSDSDIRMSI